MFTQKPKVSKPYNNKRSWNYVIWLLSRKAYTKAQLRDKLKKKEASSETIDRVIEKLEQHKFVDDALFAENYVRTRQNRKGSLALKQELRHKGVALELIDKTLEPLDTKSQLESALEVLEKTKWRLLKAEPQKRYAKAYAFLARRGFPSEVVKLTLEKSSFLLDQD